MPKVKARGYHFAAGPRVTKFQTQSHWVISRVTQREPTQMTVHPKYKILHAAFIIKLLGLSLSLSKKEQIEKKMFWERKSIEQHIERPKCMKKLIKKNYWQP